MIGNRLTVVRFVHMIGSERGLMRLRGGPQSTISKSMSHTAAFTSLECAFAKISWLVICVFVANRRPVA